MAEIRLSKLLANRGVASRREAEAMIADGQVTINGQVVLEVVPVDPDVDRVMVNGRTLPREPPKAYFLMYKPKGTITGRNDPHGRKSVLDLVKDLPIRVEPVGRLDFDTEGALLLTNDGQLANALLHPKNKIPKRYTVKVYRTPDAKDLAAIRAGVYLEDGKTHPAKVRLTDTTDKTNAWLELTVTEGRNRLVRRIFEKLGHPVSKLRRESFATISLTHMERGQVRPLTGMEIRRLKEIAAGTEARKAGRKAGKGFAKAKPKLRLGKSKRKGPGAKGRGGRPGGNR